MFTRIVSTVRQMAAFVWRCVSPLFVGIIATLSALGIATRIRDELFPQVTKYHIARILPANWTWQSWVLLLLSVLFVAFVEGAFREHMKYAERIGPVLDASGWPVDKEIEEAVPITRYIAAFVILVIVGMWVYKFLFPPDFVTITGTATFRLRPIPKGQAGSLAGVIRHFDSEMVSDKAQYPYAIKVIVQVSQTITPLTLRFECDSEIAEASASLTGLKDTVGSEKIENDSFLFTVQNPPASPEHPVVAVIYSRQKIHLKRVDRF